MSQINVDTIKKADGTGSLSVPAESGTVVTTASPSLGRRNLIINGAMQVAQRGTSGTYSASSGFRACDRVKVYHDTELTIEQSTDAPPGFGYSYKASATSNTTDSSGFNAFRWPLESQTTVCSGYGTSDAKPLTLSFWVKSGKTGKNSILFLHHSPSANSNTQRMISKPYTINSADTWEYKSVTIPADTVAFDNDSNLGLSIDFNWTLQSAATGGTYQTDSWANNTTANRMPSDQDEFITTNGDYFAITGVQLEVGSVATPFEHRSFGEELELCKRYLQTSYQYGTSIGTATLTGMRTTGGSAGGATTGYLEGDIQLSPSMRDAPSMTFYDQAGTEARCTRLLTGTGRTDGQGIASSNGSNNYIHIFSTGSANASNIQVHYEAESEL